MFTRSTLSILVTATPRLYLLTFRKHHCWTASRILVSCPETAMEMMALSGYASLPRDRLDLANALNGLVLLVRLHNAPGSASWADRSSRACRKRTRSSPERMAVSVKPASPVARKLSAPKQDSLRLSRTPLCRASICFVGSEQPALLSETESQLQPNRQGRQRRALER